MSFFNEVKIIEDMGLFIAGGGDSDYSQINKFGAAIDFDTGDNEVTCYDGADDSLFSGSPPMSYNYSTTDDISLLSSSSTGDTQDIEVQGLDINYDMVTQTVTLTGRTDVALSTNLLRVFRMKNVGTTNLAGTVYLRTAGSAQTNGVPNTANTVRAIIKNGNNQTLMAVYTVPNGYNAYLSSWYAASAGASRSTTYQIRLKARPHGQVFQLKHLHAITDDAPYQHFYKPPQVYAAKTDIEMTAEITASAITAASVNAGFDIILRATT